MNNIQKINDIKYLIMEHYSDKEPLNENQKKSKQCFYRYCDDIKQDLEKLEKLEKAIEIIKIKNVDIQYFKKCKNVTEYNKYHYSHEKLFTTEFDLIKEVFKYDK